MKNKLCLFLISMICIFTLSGCRRIIGGTILEMLGMKFTSQIEMLEECLSVQLDGLTDHSIKNIYSDGDSEGNSICIQYISLEGKGDVISSQIENNKYWNDLPCDSEIQNLLSTSTVEERCDFSHINEGSYIVSGVSVTDDFFDFNRQNADTWITYEIGIWDLDNEILYYISITSQKGFHQTKALPLTSKYQAGFLVNNK